MGILILTLGVVVRIGANSVKSFFYVWSSVSSAPLTPQNVTAPSFVPFGLDTSNPAPGTLPYLPPVRLKSRYWSPIPVL